VVSLADGGAVVTKIEARVYGRSPGVNGGSTVNVIAKLNGTELKTYSVTEEALCAQACTPTETFTFQNEDGIPAYIYAETATSKNTLRLEIPAASQHQNTRYCVNRVDLILTVKQRSLQVPSETVAFGKQKQNVTSATKTVTLHNNGEAVYKVTGLSFGDGGVPFAVSPAAPFSVDGGADAQLQVTFTPTALGPTSGTLTLTSGPPTETKQIHFTGTGVSSGADISPLSIPFGQLRVGDVKTEKVTVRNVGSEPLAVSNIAIAAPFSLSTADSANFTLAANTSKDLTVTFSPLDPTLGPLTRYLTFTTSDPENINVSVTLTGEGVKPHLTLNPAELLFSPQRVDTESAPMPVEVKNEGSGPITISSLTVPEGFLVDQDGGFTLNADGGTRVLAVTFKPKVEGEVPPGTVITLNSEDTEWDGTTIGLAGDGIRPHLVWSPTSLAFDPQRVSTPSAAKNVTVTNTGSDFITISSLSVPSGFLVDQDGGFTLGADGGSRVLAVTFRPTVEGAVADAGITLNSSDIEWNGTRIGLTGQGIRPHLVQSPPSLTFMPQRLNTSSAAQNVTVTNTGSDFITISSLSVPSGFLVNQDGGFTLGPDGGSHAFAVTYRPTVEGPVPAGTAITFNSSDIEWNGTPIGLAGQGVKPHLVLDPGALTFAPQRLNTSSTAKNVTVTNTGSGPITISNLTVPSGFLVNQDGGFTLGPDGGSQVLAVTYRPSEEGPVPAGTAITLSSEDTEWNGTTIGLAGQGVRPVLVRNPGALTFAPQRLNTSSAAQNVTVTNTGSGPITISGLSVPSGFLVNLDGGFTLGADGGSRVLAVTFRPSVEGSVPEGTAIALNSEDTEWNGTTIGLAGQGIRPVLVRSPPSLTFAPQRLNTSSVAQDVTVTNTGSDSITISSLSVPSGFLVDQDGGFTLGADGGSHAFAVTYRPTVEGPVPAGTAITFNSSDIEWNGTPIGLAGQGVRPVLVRNPGALTFAPQRLNTSSTAKNVTVTNTGSGPITISGLSVPSGFLVDQDAGFTLGPDGGSQVLAVTYRPSEEGPVPAGTAITLSSEDTEWDGTTIGLAGQGVRPVLVRNPGALTFAPQRLNTSSTAKNVTVTNTGSGPITISGLSVPSGFLVNLDGGFTLGADGGSRVLAVTYRPSVEGSVPEGTAIALNSEDTEWNGTTIGLAGQGVKPHLVLDPGALTFEPQRLNTSSVAQDVTVTNTGSGPITISNLTVPSGFLVNQNGGFTLGADGGTRVLAVTYRPTVEGPVPAGTALRLNSNDADWTSTPIGLAGQGVRPVLVRNPGALTFAPQRLNTSSAAQNVTVTNTGSGPITISGLSVPSGFLVNLDGGFTLGPDGGSQVLAVTYRPSEEGPVPAGTAIALSSEDTEWNGTTIGLTGRGVRPHLLLNPGALAFEAQRVDTLSAAKSVTVTNTGSGSITINSLTVPPNFSVNPNTGFTLGADGGSQVLAVTFRPTEEGAVTDAGLLLNSSDEEWQGTVVSLSGRGVKPHLVVAPSLSFGGQRAGIPSTPRPLTVMNTGSETVYINSISVDGDAGVFSVTPTTAFSLAADGGTQDLQVTFKPNAKESYIGTLRLGTDHEPSNSTVSLFGTGVSHLAISPVGPDGGLDLGSVRVGADAGVVVTLTSTSTAPVKIYELSLSPSVPPFAISNLSKTELTFLNDSATFTLSFKPEEEGVLRTAEILVRSDASNGPEHRLRVAGKGTAAEAKIIAFDLPPPYTNPEHPAVSSLDFGNVRLSTTAVTTLRLVNMGDVALSFPVNKPPEVSNPVFSYLGQSTVTIPPGGNIPFQVSFKPASIAPFFDTLKIFSDAKNNPLLLNLSGNGTYSEVKIDRNAIFFGDVRVGDVSSPVAVLVSNPGTAPLTVQSPSVTGPFIAQFASLPDGGFPLPDGGSSAVLVVPPGSSTNLNVSFKPTKGEVLDGSVTILTDANRGGGVNLPDGGVESPGVLNVALQGNGTIAVVGLSDDLVFGEQRVGLPSVAQPVIISNIGGAELTIEQFVFTNTAFAITEDSKPDLPFEIGAGGKKTIYVAFTPLALSTTTGRLQIVSDAHAAVAPLELTGTGVDGELRVTPSAVSFQQVEVGALGVQQSLVIKNIGGSSLKLTEVPTLSNPAFTVSGLEKDMVLDPDDEWPFKVTFQPRERGDQFGTLKITSDAHLKPIFNLALSGTGVAPAVILQPSEIAFGTSNVGVTVTQNISVKNVGERSLSISNISFEDGLDGGTSAALDFEAVANLPLVVQPPPDGGSVIVPLKFTPRTANMRQAWAVFHTNAPATDGGIVKAKLQGEGTSPGLRLEPRDKLDFGKVLVGSPSSQKILKLTNRGTGPLKVKSVTLGGGADASRFTMAPLALPITLPPSTSSDGGSELPLEVSLTLRPDAERLFQASLVVESDDPVLPSATVGLVGEGVRQQITVDPTSLDFRRQLLNHPSKPLTVRITNSSDTIVTLSSLVVEGTGRSQFSTNLSLPLDVPALGYQDVEVRFTPLAEAEVDCTLKIFFSNLPAPFEVALHGQGIPSVLSVEPSPLDFGTIRAGSSDEMTLTLRNLSNDDIVLAKPKEEWKRGEVFTYEGGLIEGQTIGPNGFLSVNVKYAPTKETLSETRLEFGTSTPLLPNAAAVELKGRATARLLNVDPVGLDFGWVNVKEEVEPKTITIFNHSAEAQRVVVMLPDFEGSPFKVASNNIPPSIPAGGSATFTVSFVPTKAGDASSQVEVWIEGDRAAEAVIAVKGQGRSLTGEGGGCSCGTEAGSAGVLALLALVGLGSRRRRRA
jgi:MYXO-CTERM domain-containing protein